MDFNLLDSRNKSLHKLAAERYFSQCLRIWVLRHEAIHFTNFYKAGKKRTEYCQLLCITYFQRIGIRVIKRIEKRR